MPTIALFFWLGVLMCATKSIFYIGCCCILISIFQKNGIKKALPSFLLGGGYLYLVVQLIFLPDFSTHYWNRWVTVNGQIISIPKQSLRQQKFLFRIRKLNNKKTNLKVLFINYDLSYQPKVGEIWQWKAKIKPIHGLKNPGGNFYEQGYFPRVYF